MKWDPGYNGCIGVIICISNAMAALCSSVKIELFDLPPHPHFQLGKTLNTLLPCERVMITHPQKPILAHPNVDKSTRSVYTLA